MLVDWRDKQFMAPYNEWRNDNRHKGNDRETLSREIDLYVYQIRNLQWMKLWLAPRWVVKLRLSISFHERYGQNQFQDWSFCFFSTFYCLHSGVDINWFAVITHIMCDCTLYRIENQFSVDIVTGSHCSGSTLSKVMDWWSIAIFPLTG